MDNTNFYKFNIKQTSSSALLLPENFEAVKYQAYKTIDDLDWDEATKFAKDLEEKLKSLLGSKNQKDLYYYNILRYWVLRLKLFAFRNLSGQEKSEFFKNNAIEAISKNLDLKHALFKYVDFYQYDKIIKEDTKSFIVALNASSEILGSDIGQFQQSNFKPIISNWLKEYQIVINTLNSGSTQAGAFHIVKFMDTNKYVKYLTVDEKRNLRELLDLYNWLLNPIIYSDAEPLEQSTPYTQSQRLELPKEILQPAEPKLPPIAPMPKASPNLRRMGDVGNIGIKNQELRIKEINNSPRPPIVQKDTVKPPVFNNTPAALKPSLENKPIFNLKPAPVLPQKPGNAWSQIQPGLNIRPPQNYKMPPKPIQNENIQEKIDKKLEDLEKRVE